MLNLKSPIFNYKISILLSDESSISAFLIYLPVLALEYYFSSPPFRNLSFSSFQSARALALAASGSTLPRL